MATLATFRAMLPMFSAVADETIQTYLDIAAPDATEDQFGEQADAAHVFLTAHLLSLVGIGPAAQAGSLSGFTNIKAGSLSLTRSEKAAAGDFASSQFGILYWQMSRGSHEGTAIMVTGTGTIPGDIYAYPHGQG